MIHEISLTKGEKFDIIYIEKRKKLLWNKVSFAKLLKLLYNIYRKKKEKQSQIKICYIS